MHYFMIAGEASGDIHAAGLIRALRVADPDARVTFFGGDLMADAAGHAPVVHYREMAYMGISEVLRHLPQVRRNLQVARRIIEQERPDAVIFVDYPSFNLRLAPVALRARARTYYYIPPKIWAWKEWRVRKIRRYLDDVFCILPFEPAFYASYGMNVNYVGNPTACEIAHFLNEHPDTATNDNILALIPGSRRGEIRNNLPVMLEVARRHPELRAVVSIAPGIEPSFYDQFGDFERAADSFALMRQARAALVTSGTATLECALLGTPQVACYRSNGSRLVYNLRGLVLKIPFVTLPNLIAACEVIPEMLLCHCNADEVDARLTPLLSDTPARRAQTDGYAEIKERLGTSDPSTSAAVVITENLRGVSVKSN